jgi:hypothetical protein
MVLDDTERIANAAAGIKARPIQGSPVPVGRQSSTQEPESLTRESARSTRAANGCDR